ncbi:proline--tRNA ligase [Acidiferrobacter thiooxydans]|jgi:prolyl-tRNA synthetase|uniref:Proline--tRNA ligase n=1 Tax=Acidiferrobacter thiooxydans TaxID=163359 RepID=A0A1C2G489_9GAMM|nr:proline--tRNA ligase [Acidiferrobacter thiooxydans]MDA8192258.1 proline--tRNA ligase [Gammaproteobacteria bacterium]RCN56535.1 proline--tRNA ligase [Acidiferrobacter thiooxydans]UEN99184.1 proline--tRNA ligase [Acidiferrobacter thiooxydans]
MRTQALLLATLKENPADAEIVSHRLMLRAGMIRKLASGLYTWLPMGLRVLRKVEAIVREEMNRSGAQEVLMPAVQPAELWQESERWQYYGPELLRLTDRHDRAFCFGPTHEEVITDLARREIRSYRQLPMNFYQIQTKFRDEVRPRFGVMRAREFLMKDAYSFHADQASLKATYEIMYATYQRIFTRLGLRFRAVRADTGSIGGDASHEFHVLADTGEDAIITCPACDYAANVELAQSGAAQARATAAETLAEVSTGTAHSVDEVAQTLSVSTARILKTVFIKGIHGPIALYVRGDREINPVKAAKVPNALSPLTFATPAEVRIAGGVPGAAGPKGLAIPGYADPEALALADFVCGANREDHHFKGANWGRDFPEPAAFDLREVVAGDPCPQCATALERGRGIEVGHIFQLGTKYSSRMAAGFLDETGRSQPFIMGCYGIGVSRVVAAAIEQNHDERGIVWPTPIAPFAVAIVPIGFHNSPQVAQAAQRLYDDLLSAGIDVLLDDRDERPGVLFGDMDLIGLPHRLVIGDRGLKAGTIEYKGRGDAEPENWPLADVRARLAKRLAS